MPNASLVVHDFSYGFVRRFVDHLHGLIRRHLDPQSELFICSEVDAAAYPDGLVFMIGENLPAFRRRPGCVYAYLNFSVVTLLGSPFAASLGGHRQVLRKRRMFSGKLPLIDMLLDYYPPQTARLETALSLPVMGFDVAVAPSQPDRTAPSEYDVCFVGSMTPRRRRVLDDIKAKGIRLSPSQGAPIEEVAARSDLCLNIHTERSNHLEVPRFVAALSTGCPMVSETSFGIDALGAGDFVIERPLPSLADAVLESLQDRPRLQALQTQSLNWYRTQYLPRTEARWCEIFEQATALYTSQNAPALHASLGH